MTPLAFYVPLSACEWGMLIQISLPVVIVACVMALGQTNGWRRTAGRFVIALMLASMGGGVMLAAGPKPPRKANPVWVGPCVECCETMPGWLCWASTLGWCDCEGEEGQ